MVRVWGGKGRKGRRQLIPIKESAAKRVPQLKKDKEKFLQQKNQKNAYR